MDTRARVRLVGVVSFLQDFRISIVYERHDAPPPRQENYSKCTHVTKMQGTYVVKKPRPLHSIGVPLRRWCDADNVIYRLSLLFSCRRVLHASAKVLIRVHALGGSEARKLNINRRCKIQIGDVQGQLQVYLHFPFLRPIDHK